MAGEFLGVFSALSITVCLVLGFVFGFLAPGIPHLRYMHGLADASIVLGGGLAFFLVMAGIRALDSPTPDVSVARNLAIGVHWAFYVGAGVAGWTARRRTR